VDVIEKAGERVERAGRMTSRVGRRRGGFPSLRAWLEEASPELRWDWPHLAPIQEALERITSGELRRLMLFVPPRHGKSELVTVRYPVYRLERDPKLRVIVAAHSADLAQSFSRMGRSLARERLFMSDERTAVEEWQTKAGGGLRPVGVQTGVTGRGAGLIVIDDPVAGYADANTEKKRDAVWEWYRNDLHTRCAAGAAILLIQTRWHEDDLAGRILKSEDGPNWEVIRIPAYAETQEERDEWARKHGRPRGVPDPVGREPGEPLCTGLIPVDELERQRRTLGPVGFSALYQQTPHPAAGGMFQREWFRVIEEPPPIRFVRFWDCASKAGPHNSYTAGALLGRDAFGKWYLKHVVRGKWDYPDAKRVILSTAELDGSSVPVGIEDTANGTALIQDLQRHPGRHRFIAIKVRGDKVTRAGPWASLAQGGFFHLTAGGWCEAFLDEAQAFPFGHYDDQIDAVSGAHEMLVQHNYLLSSFTEEEKLRWASMGPPPRPIFDPRKCF
jgi:predicted phage terminase large subunit-like protein